MPTPELWATLGLKETTIPASLLEQPCLAKEKYAQAGAGIVADSVPENEFQETINKAKGMLKAIALAERIEQSSRPTS